MIKRTTVSVATLALCAALAVGCGGDDDESDATSPAAVTDPADDPDATSIVTEATTEATATPAAETTEPAAATEFTIAEFTFAEGFVATAGEEFTITNEDGFTHTVTSTDFDVEVGGDSSEQLTIDAAGTYDIVCKIHPQMTGTITVE